MWNAQWLAIDSVLLQPHRWYSSLYNREHRGISRNSSVSKASDETGDTNPTCSYVSLCFLLYFLKSIAWFILLWFADHVCFFCSGPSIWRSEKELHLVFGHFWCFPSGAISHSSYTVYRPICRLHTHKTVTHKFTKGHFIVRSIFN